MLKTKKSYGLLTIGALGVVFGDIGTSPLYAMKAVFDQAGLGLPINEQNINGIVSIIIWSITVVVSIKYINFIMRANNNGEGGIIALIAQIKNKNISFKLLPYFIILGIFGIALFYGDSVITPAISVLSAVEGLKVVTPQLGHYVIPITIFLLVGLFWIQKYGTGFIGKLFGPIMLCWFITLGIAGALNIADNSSIIMALSPASALAFITHQPLTAFLTMSAITLVITGAEALYADMGHFGRKPIARAWFFIVMPALILCYMGQGALLLNNPATISNPFLHLFPHYIQFTIVILAAMATLIASQAVISGAFSLTQQAIHLGFLPKMLIRHTSDTRSGQVYLPFVNYFIFIAVMLLVIIFGSSDKLANAYGMAVSATLAIDTILFAIVARYIWHKSMFYICVILSVFLTIDLIFATSNVSKILKGAWFPIIIAIIVLVFIYTWQHGTKIVTKERQEMEGSLTSFVKNIRKIKPKLTRVPGLAIYIGHHATYTPMALLASVEKLHEIHEKVIIVNIEIENIPHIEHANRVAFDSLGYDNDGICHIELKYGYHDYVNIPRTLESLQDISPELKYDTKSASYFVSLNRVVATGRHNMSKWQKYLYIFMSNSATSTTDYYHLPIDQTIEMRSLIKL